MLQIKHQKDYSDYDYEILKNSFNSDVLNLAELHTNLVLSIPKDIDTISGIADKLTNLVIVSGDTYFHKTTKDMKVIENSNIHFDSSLNSVKLKALEAYSLTPKEGLTRFITDKSARILDKDKKSIKDIDSLGIRKETVAIVTEENSYKYTLNFNFNTIASYNNLVLRLNPETLSYPNIAEIYYIDKNREKINIRILNNNSYEYNIDLNKNNSNYYSLDLERVEADNIYIVFEDVGLDLILDEVTTSYTEYPDSGYIILEVLNEDSPVIKVGTEAKGLEGVKFFVSTNLTDWITLHPSNTYNIENTNRVVSFNTVANNTIRTEQDVKKVYLKLELHSSKESFIPDSPIQRDIFHTPIYNTDSNTYTDFSVYEYNTSINYGAKTVSNTFDFKSLYDNGEYLTIDNNVFIKGFVETPISKTYTSNYVYSPVTLTSKVKRVSGDTITSKTMDISTRELYTYQVRKITKNLVDSTDIKYVLPMKEEYRQGIYYIKQEGAEIPIDLSLGYINSTVDVLYSVKPEVPVLLLDESKELVSRTPLPQYTIKGVSVVSLLDSNLFEEIEYLSKFYPIQPLDSVSIGLLDNTLIADNINRSITAYELESKRLYTKDYISDKNTNFSKIVSEEDYKLSLSNVKVKVPAYSKTYSVTTGNIVKGSLRID